MGCSHHYSVLHRIINPVFYVKDLGRYVSKLGSIYEKMFLSISLSRIFILFQDHLYVYNLSYFSFYKHATSSPYEKKFCLTSYYFWCPRCVQVALLIFVCVNFGYSEAFLGTIYESTLVQLVDHQTFLILPFLSIIIFEMPILEKMYLFSPMVRVKLYINRQLYSRIAT